MEALAGAAAWYRNQGWFPVPIPSGRKGPSLSNWQNLRIEPDRIPDWFNGTGNIGLILGEPSGWLVDVDLDCPEAVELAPSLLPPTVRSGRTGNPGSHLWYRCEGAPSVKLTDPVTGEMIIELRSTGLQTVVWPSIHPEGDQYEPIDGEPATVSAPMLEALVRALAAEVIRRRGHDQNPVRMSPAEPSGSSGPLSDRDREARAIAYLEQCPAAVSGQGGHAATLWAARCVAWGFDLDEESTLSILLQHYNPRCEPEWTEKQLRHKASEARKPGFQHPCGWLLESSGEWSLDPIPDVDLSSILEDEEHEPAPAILPAEDPVSHRPAILPEHLWRPPGFLSQVIDYTLRESTVPQPVLALAGALCLLSTLTGRKIRAADGTRSNIFCVGTCSSAGGKDAAMQSNSEILSRHAPELAGPEDIASHTGVFSALAANPCLLFQIDEMGLFIRALSGGQAPYHVEKITKYLLTAWSRSKSSWREAAYADAEKNRVIVQPHAVLYGVTVPGTLFRAFSRESLEGGFVARMLIFEGHPLSQLGIEGEQSPENGPIPDQVVEAVKGWQEFDMSAVSTGVDLEDTGTGETDPWVVPWGPGSEELLQCRRQEIWKKREQAASEAESAIWGRVMEKSIKLALLHAASLHGPDPEQLVIGVPSLDWAFGVVDFLTRRLFQLAEDYTDDSPRGRLAKDVVRFVRSQGAVTRTEISCRFRALKPRDLTELLTQLVQEKSLVTAIEMRGPKGNVRTDVFRCAD